MSLRLTRKGTLVAPPEVTVTSAAPTGRPGGIRNVISFAVGAPEGTPRMLPIDTVASGVKLLPVTTARHAGDRRGSRDAAFTTDETIGVCPTRLLSAYSFGA